MPISHVLCYVAKKHFVKPHTLLQRVVKTPLYHCRSLKILRQQTLWQQIYRYFIESPCNYRNDDYFQMIILVQPHPPCTQCRTSEKAAFPPTGATTMRSSSPSSQPLIGLPGNIHRSGSHTIVNGLYYRVSYPGYAKQEWSYVALPWWSSVACWHTFQPW